MSVIQREIIDAADGKRYAWDGLTSDPLPTNALILHPGTNALYDHERTLGETPQTPLLRVPRTTWYQRPFSGYGPNGCVPLYERKQS